MASISTNAFAIAFYLTAAVAVASAVMVVWHRNPVVNALYLVMCFFAVAVCYVFLHAHFLAAIQVLLYAGAVLVLFLMLIMLMNLSESELGRAKPSLGKALGGFMALGVIILLALVLNNFRDARLPVTPAPRLAAFLIHLGDDAAEYPREAQAVQLTPRETVQIGREALTLMNQLQDRPPEQRRRFPEELTYLELPAIFQEMSPALVLRINQEFLDSLTPEVIDIKAMPRPISRGDLSQEQVLDYVKSIVRAQYLYYSEFGGTRSVGMILFTRYLLPFEAAAILLLGAIVAVLLLAGRPEEES